MTSQRLKFKERIEIIKKRSLVTIPRLRNNGPQKRSKRVNYAAMHSSNLDGYDQIYFG